ncbi:hypothetical protein [Synechocystis sp. CACIAM 05]|uniref:hypothetical protein n=1 Tax=Synechocystis sp. CACIAM 05 TaxID=1933929 RepID=UPI00138E88E9|nr:hypothetical protein [Synechocystis sp. CACIAM 05]QHV01327.1 hypothetical protein BWK47_15100 [Synechocystis sp. CACIAM 05]
MLDNIDIYVKSTAIGITGIHWRHASESDQPIGTPKIVQEKICDHKDGFPLMVNDLLDQTSPSLLVYRSGGKLLVEIAGIESVKTYGSHNDSQLRSYDLLALIFDDNPENEKIVRKIAHDAIENILGNETSLFEMIKSFVSFYQKEEFRVDLESIKAYLDKLNKINLTEETQTVEQTIEIRSNGKLEKLSELILKNPLPKEWEFRDYNNDRQELLKSDRVLLVVTDRLEQEDIFYHAGIWLGSASNVKEPEVIKEIQGVSQLQQNENVNSQSRAEERKRPKKINLIAVVLVLTLTIILILLIVLHPVVIKNYQDQDQNPPQSGLTQQS